MSANCKSIIVLAFAESAELPVGKVIVTCLFDNAGANFSSGVGGVNVVPGSAL